VTEANASQEGAGLPSQGLDVDYPVPRQNLIRSQVVALSARPATIAACDHPRPPTAPAPPLPRRRSPPNSLSRTWPCASSSSSTSEWRPGRGCARWTVYTLGRVGQSLDRLEASSGHLLARHRPTMAAPTLPRVLGQALRPAHRGSPAGQRRQADRRFKADQRAGQRSPSPRPRGRGALRDSA
jgi:hypothetical protein